MQCVFCHNDSSTSNSVYNIIKMCEKKENIEELNNRICGYSFINVISYFALTEQFYSKELLSYDEKLFIIGLWLKNINGKHIQGFETHEDVEAEAKVIYDLLEGLHISYMFDPASIDNAHSTTEFHNSKFETPYSIQESIFYCGDGAYDLQYTSLIADKYGNDSDWILQNKGVDIYKFHKFYIAIKQILIRKLEDFRNDLENNNYSSDYDISFPFIIDIAEIGSIDCDYLKIIDLFSFDIKNPPEVNINGIEDFNPLVEYPLIKISETQLYIPYCNIVANSLYELPFFWIVKDKKYYEQQGKHNRGDAAETLTKKLLERIFTQSSVFKNVNIYIGKKTCTEIDVLVKHEDIAIIFQVKSKRLSLESRKGNKEKIADDFKNAIGEAYEQAVASESSMKDTNAILKDKNGIISISGVKNTLKIGVTLDFFPAVDIITCSGLGKVPFISMSIFDLDMLTRCLNAEQFVDYLSYRLQYRGLSANSEATYLGFYLKHNGFGVIDNNLRVCDNVYLGEDNTPLIDKIMNMYLVKEYLPDLYEQIIQNN